MAIVLAVPKETTAGEYRVAMVPGLVDRLAKMGVTVKIQSGAGIGAGAPDDHFKNATIVSSADELMGSADIVVRVQPPSLSEIDQLKPGALLIGFLASHAEPERIKKLRDKKITSFSMELIPRISRAQAMDVLSSQASVAGYKAVLIAANLSRRFFPMLTTAAGTIRPAKVVIIGAGVAGLQAIATARRLGAIVEGYDVRAATKEQVESLGAKFIQVNVKAEGSGGYARELTAEEKQEQQAILAKHIAAADAVISTAAIPGKPAPRIITKEMVAAMKPGSVIVDLAAESGGNCELTKAGEVVDFQGVMISGPTNVPSALATHASEMYAKNIFNLLELIVKDGAIALDWDDPIIAESVVTHDGSIRNAAVRSRIEGDTA